MSVSGLVMSVCRRALTIRDRAPEYVHWQRAVVAVFIGILLFAGSLYGIYRARGLRVPVAILLMALVIAAVYRRKRFLSPSSVRLQTKLFLTIHALTQLRNRNLRQLVRNSVERRPLSGAVAAPVWGLVAFPFATVVYNLYLQNYSIAGSIDETVWIVHATVTGFSFIVLIFFWEYLGGEFDNSVLIRTAVRYTWSLHIIYFLLAANVAIGVLAILAQGDWVVPLIGVQGVLFLLSIAGIYWIYDIVYNVMVEDALTPRVKRRLDQQIGVILTEQDQDPWKTLITDQLDRNYPQFALADFVGGQERATADDLEMSGEVTDIHLHRLHDLFDEAADLDVTIEQLPLLGRIYNDDDDIFVYEGDITPQETEQLHDRLERAFKVK